MLRKRRQTGVRARGRTDWGDKVFCHGKTDALELTETVMAAQDLGKHSSMEWGGAWESTSLAEIGC